MVKLQNTNTINIEVTTSSGCPSNAVPVNSEGICPSGYTYDPNNPLCCIPQCSEQPCPAGQRWSSNLCKCLYIPANSISNPAIYQTLIGYNITLTADASLLAFGALPDGTASCQGWFGNTGTTGNQGNDIVLVTRTFKFTVLDVNGNPIPHVPLTFYNNQLYTVNGKNVYAINAPPVTGQVQIGAILPPETDDNGEATITLDIYFILTGDSQTSSTFSVGQTESTGLINGSISVSADNHGTGTVSADLAFEISMIFCSNRAAAF